MVTLLGQWNARSHACVDVVAQVVFPTQGKALEEVQVLLWKFANGDGMVFAEVQRLMRSKPGLATGAIGVGAIVAALSLLPLTVLMSRESGRLRGET